MSKRIPLNYEKWLGNATAVSQYDLPYFSELRHSLTF